MRCILLSCSQRKLTTEEVLPALDRYDGPMFRIVRRYLREHPGELGNQLMVGIISARYGLLLPEAQIPHYDLRMNRERALSLQAETVRALHHWLISYEQLDLFLALGKEYQLAIEPLDCWLPANLARLTIATGGSGIKQQQLVSWLERGQAVAQPRQWRLEEPAVPSKGEAVLRGVKIRATPAEIEERVKAHLATGDESCQKSKEWLAQVGPYRVSPKWLVSYLSGVPISGFAADDARRVLSQLGIVVLRR